VEEAARLINSTRTCTRGKRPLVAGMKRKTRVIFNEHV
jgi:hypothetical protein